MQEEFFVMSIYLNNAATSWPKPEAVPEVMGGYGYGESGQPLNELNKEE